MLYIILSATAEAPRDSEGMAVGARRHWRAPTREKRERVPAPGYDPGAALGLNGTLRSLNIP